MCICCQVSSNQAQAHEPLKVVLHNQTNLLQLSASEKLQAMQICDIPEREASLSLIRLLLLLSLLLSGLTPACALFLFLDLLQSLHMTWKQKVKQYEAICAMVDATHKHTATLFTFAAVELVCLHRTLQASVFGIHAVQTCKLLHKR